MNHDEFMRLAKIDVSRETFEKLEQFVHLVEKWNPAINVVSKRSLAEIWTRHIIDSVQVYSCAPDVVRWLDIGSGGGFPGAVVGILSSGTGTSQSVTLMESDQRKCAFLRTVSRETHSGFKVMSSRIEQADAHGTDVLSARALADLTTLFSFCERHLKYNGTALLPKGATWKKEVEAAQRDWKFEFEPITSMTEAEAVILKVRGIERA